MEFFLRWRITKQKQMKGQHPNNSCNSPVPEWLKSAFYCTEDLSKWFCFLPGLRWEHIATYPVTPPCESKSSERINQNYPFQSPDIQLFCEELIKNDVSNWQSLQVAAVYVTVPSLCSKPYRRRDNVCSFAGHVGKRMPLHLRRTESSLFLGAQGTVHTLSNLPENNAHSDSQLLYVVHETSIYPGVSSLPLLSAQGSGLEQCAFTYTLLLL